MKGMWDRQFMGNRSLSRTSNRQTEENVEQGLLKEKFAAITDYIFKMFF